MLKVLHIIGVKNGWAIQKRGEALLRVMADVVDGEMASHKDVTLEQMNEADFVHIHGLQIVPLLRRILPQCKTPWGFEVISERSLKHLEGSKELLKKCFCCWCKNPRLIDLVKDFVHGEILYVPNGVDTDLFVPKKVKVGWVGNKRDDHHLEYKGVPLIKEAVAILNEKYNGGFTFEPDPSNYPSKVLPQSELVPYYQGLDVLVCGSKAEGCSNIVNEALACGIPVVTTAVGIAFELSEEKLVACVERSAEGIAHGIDCVEGRIRRARAMENYSWSSKAVRGAYYQSYLASQEGEKND